jgi:hypothetical protein
MKKERADFANYIQKPYPALEKLLLTISGENTYFVFQHRLIEREDLKLVSLPWDEQ